jgi:proline dehydrogenase
MKLLGVSRKLLGKKLFNLLMKSTFYGHFVAGENPSDIRPNVQGMMKYGVKSILDYSAEEDLESEGSVKEHQSSTSSVTNSKRKLFDPSELQFEKNTKIFINCIDAVADVTNKTGLAALKFTSLIKPQLLLKFSSAIAEYKKNESKLSKDLLAWKNLVNMKDEEFDKLFNQTLVFDVSFYRYYF